MQCILSFTAEGIVRDARTNNITAYSILEEINSAGFPLFWQKIFYFCLLKKDEGDQEEYNLNARVVNNENVILEMPVTINFQHKAKHRHIMEIGGIAIPAPGTLEFQLFRQDGELVSSYSILVNRIGQPEARTVE